MMMDGDRIAGETAKKGKGAMDGDRIAAETTKKGEDDDGRRYDRRRNDQER